MPTAAHPSRFAPPAATGPARMAAVWAAACALSPSVDWRRAAGGGFVMAWGGLR